jgi:hypothetical protein
MTFALKQRKKHGKTSVSVAIHTHTVRIHSHYHNDDDNVGDDDDNVDDDDDDDDVKNQNTILCAPFFFSQMLRQQVVRVWIEFSWFMLGFRGKIL